MQCRTSMHLPEARALEVAVEARQQDVLAVHVGRVCAELQQVRQELRLVDGYHLEQAVLLPGLPPELRQAVHRKASLHMMNKDHQLTAKPSLACYIKHGPAGVRHAWLPLTGRHG